MCRQKLLVGPHSLRKPKLIIFNCTTKEALWQVIAYYTQAGTESDEKIY